MAYVGERDSSRGLLRRQQAAALTLWSAALTDGGREPRRPQPRKPLQLHPALLLLCLLTPLPSALGGGEASGASRRYPAAATTFLGAEEGRGRVQEEEQVVNSMQSVSATSEGNEDRDDPPPLLLPPLQGGQGFTQTLRLEEAVPMEWGEEEGNGEQQSNGSSDPQGEDASLEADMEGDLDSELPPHVWGKVDEGDHALFEESWGSDDWTNGLDAEGKEGGEVVHQNTTAKAMLLRLVAGATSMPACNEDEIARSLSDKPQICHIPLEFAEEGEEDGGRGEGGESLDEEVGREGQLLANQTQVVQPLHRRSLSAPIQAVQVPLVFQSAMGQVARVLRMYGRRAKCRKPMRRALWAVARARVLLKKKDRSNALVRIDQARRIITACMVGLKRNLPRRHPATQQRWSLTMAKNYLTALKLFITARPTKRRAGANRGGFFGPIIIKNWQKRILFRLASKKQKRHPTTQRVVTAWNYIQQAVKLVPRTSGCKPLLAKAGEAVLNSLLLLNLKRRRASLDQITLVDTAVRSCMPRRMGNQLGRMLTKAHNYITAVVLYLAFVQKKRKKRRSTMKGRPDIPKGTTGNPVDDCWIGDPNWENNRQNLADCAAGYGENAGGGYGGPMYVVTTTADDPVNPVYGSLRYGVTRDGPLWITFARDMTFALDTELYINSYKTIDARGANVVFSNGLCIVVREAYNVIIHGLTFFNCSVRSGEALIRMTPTLVSWIGDSIGHAVLVQSAVNVWVDHCAFDSTVLSTDGKHVDVKIGSTLVTVSNCYFQNQDKVMLLGHSDNFFNDGGMKVSVMLNVFGRNLVQRMPRCRFGDFHVVNNYYPHGWAMYAVGGSSNPTILSQSNYYVAAAQKEVTKRNVDAGDFDANWQRWNWKSKGDAFIAGAFFRQSGAQASLQPGYTYAVQPASSVPRITRSAGPLLCRIGSTCIPQARVFPVPSQSSPTPVPTPSWSPRPSTSSPKPSRGGGNKFKPRR